MEDATQYEITLVERERQDTAVVCGRVEHGGFPAFLGAAFGEVIAAVGVDAVAGPPFCRMEMDGDVFLVEAGFPVGAPIEASGRVEPSSLPAGPAATVMNVGPYETVAPAYFAVEAWLREHGWAPAGAPWESYLDGPEVAAPRTLVTWPCRREESAPDEG